ncbi:hypothetical protein [Haloglomus litoreum]|uniref:hypothetical protein n=1 Tax=Haloglomus litoreum TaxID=3034026 RepID=UPI0023E7B585|nr:hypothetical protein [Haloglomus sp. DT116]
MSAERQRGPDGPQPACNRTGSNWSRETATGGLLAFHPPCQRCFPEDGPGEGDPVIRARGTAGNRLHRPAEDGGAD